jgi:hypothetical protein
MSSFAIPSFYDGRVRVNLIGRESNGLIPIEGYAAELDRLEGLLRQCTDPVTGEPVVGSVQRAVSDPLAAGPTEADLIIQWRGIVHGLEHPQLGTFGPFPTRRTGGHSGGLGALLALDPSLAPGDRGTRSSFDVTATLVEIGGGDVSGVSGRVIDELAAAVRSCP